MVPSLELSSAVSLGYIALKLLSRIWESDVKKETLFHIFLHIFYKNFKILVLRYNLSHFVPNFIKIDKTLA